VLNTVSLFAAELRRSGVAVTPPEVVDAVRALRCTDLEDRSAVRSALAATLVKRADQVPPFDVLFELFFSPQISAGSGGVDRLAELDDDALRELLVRALAVEDDQTCRRIAEIAVDRFAGFEPGRAVAGRLYAMRVARGLALDDIETGVAAVLEARQARVDGVYDKAPAVAADRVQGFRQRVDSRIRTMLVADRGAAAVAATVRPTVSTSADFMDASASDLAGIESVVGPLAAALTARIRTQRRVRATRPDMRATLRRSLSTGGLLTELAYRRPRPPRVDLVVLADVSGSVSRFSAFTFMFLHAMSGVFPRLRCFAFLDGAAEVTEVIRRARTPADAAARITADQRLVWLDGHSDYGHALTAFATDHVSALTGNAVVLVLGDARTNHQNPQAQALRAIRNRVRALHWLNPEPRRYWGTGDSVMPQYASLCDSVTECRNIAQLRRALEALGE
jgi:uncharacterized protein with von Willebrand factor type A (vWA) domain